MVERKTKRDFGNGPQEVSEIGFRATGEHWNEYLTDDGSVIRVKLVVTEILRIDGAYDVQGNPMYVVASQNVVAISAAEDKRKDL